MRWQAKRSLNWHRDWHRWFAWYPVRVGDQWIWWEHVERKLTPSYDGWDKEYR